MITYIFGGDGVDLHSIIQQSHAALSIYPHSRYIFDPMPTLKGVWIQEGSLLGWLYTLGTSIRRFFGVLAVVRGVQAPFFNVALSLPFNCAFSLKLFMSGQLQIKCSGYYSDSSTSSPVEHPLQPSPSTSVTPLIPSRSSLSLSSSIPACSFSKCAKCTAGAFGVGWLPLSFCSGKKLTAHGFGALSVV